jgi:hypothetical protein
VIEHMYLARCNQQLGETTAAENNWQRALESAAGDPQKLLPLAEYAEKNGAAALAEIAYNTIVRDTPGLRAAQQGRLRLAQQSRDTRKVHGVLEQMLKQWPNDTAIQNDEAYTKLLQLPDGNEKPEVRDQRSDSSLPGDTRAVASSPSILRPLSSELSEIAALAEDLVRREPASLPHRTLLALARLKQGQPARAVEVYSGINVPHNALSPAALAVHAAVLAENGQRADAKTEAADLRPEQLLPEEQALISGL